MFSTQNAFCLLLKPMLVTKLSTSFQQIGPDRLFSSSPYMTLFNIGAIGCASGNAIHISSEVIEFGTVGTDLLFIQNHSDVFLQFSEIQIFPDSRFRFLLVLILKLTEISTKKAVLVSKFRFVLLYIQIFSDTYSDFMSDLLPYIIYNIYNLCLFKNSNQLIVY